MVQDCKALIEFTDIFPVRCDKRSLDSESIAFRSRKAYTRDHTERARLGISQASGILRIIRYPLRSVIQSNRWSSTAVGPKDYI